MEERTYARNILDPQSGAMLKTNSFRPQPPEIPISELARFGISLDQRLLRQFDALIGAKGYVNRSEAIRDLIRGSLVEAQWSREDAEQVGIKGVKHGKLVTSTTGQDLP